MKYAVGLVAIKGLDLILRSFLVEAISREEAVGKSIAIGQKVFPERRIEVWVVPDIDKHLLTIEGASIEP